MSDSTDVERLRELQRRAFSRPRTDEEAADAERAAAELAALMPAREPAATTRSLETVRAPATNALPERDAAERDDPFDDDPSPAERAWRATVARMRGATRAERRGAAIAAVALLAATGILAGVHVALTSPPPAYAVFADGARADGADGTSAGGASPERDEESAARDLESAAVELAAGPRALGEPRSDPRLVVYRQRVSDSITEPCMALLIDRGFLTGHTCTTEEAFRTEGLEQEWTDGGAFTVVYAWRPDGSSTLEVEQRGAITLDEVRALDIPALEQLEAGPTPADQLIWNYSPGTIAGPLLLAEVEGTQWVGLLTDDQDGFGRLGDAPQFCLWVGDRSGNAGACTSVEDFAENGMTAPEIGGVASGASQPFAATWLPSGELVLEERAADEEASS
ncbi:hypothetical protein [Yonghaparkia sp. Soil809]|uniref:hypothetical protein n=1 Tax=Yonghaparkia sp. Soil809 TaxID=1736417 RepID=UPI00070200D1|nr:hypothetical protein [Yonghaparkia sp. Soil809]KRF31525.1 hypothetical protein ASG83_12270 [Yonghaparkia sp. Soil809]